MPRQPKCVLCNNESMLVFSGPNRGHYITIVKSRGFWLLFDDDIMEVSPWPYPLLLPSQYCYNHAGDRTAHNRELLWAD